jgi:hypothetical protein
MGIVGLLRDTPHIAYSVSLGREFEVRLANQIDDLVGWEKIAGVEVDSTLSLPDDNLPHGEAGHNVRAVLK